MRQIFKQPQNKFGCTLFAELRGHYHESSILNTPQNFDLNQATQKIFLPNKFQTQNILRSSPSLEIRSTPPPPSPPTGRKAVLASNYTLQLRIRECHAGIKCDLKGTKHYSHCIWLSHDSKYKSYLTRKS